MNTQKIDERAQIVFDGPNVRAHVLRYRTVKKAQEAFAGILKAWAEYKKGKRDGVIVVNADMFTSAIDIGQYSVVSMIDLDKHAKFIPWTSN